MLGKGISFFLVMVVRSSMRIIVMDDDKLFLKNIRDDIEKLLHTQGIDVEIYMAYDIRMLESIMEMTVPDLIFLDIDMPDKPGIDIAHELRKRYEGIDIIFLTNREDMVFKSIHYLPFRFIRKSKIDDELKEAVLSYIEYFNDKKLMYTFDVTGGRRPILISNIFYIESEGHYAIIHTKEESIYSRSNISNLENDLKKYGFIRIQRSFLVNLKYVSNITGKNVILVSGEELPIKRGSMENIRRKLFEYRRDKYSGAGYKD